MNNHELIDTLKYIQFNTIADKLDHAIKTNIMDKEKLVNIGIPWTKFRTEFCEFITDTIKTQSEMEAELCEHIHSRFTEPKYQERYEYIMNNKPLADLLFNPNKLDTASKQQIEYSIDLRKRMEEKNPGFNFWNKTHNE
jgi:hypothetical protein